MLKKKNKRRQDGSRLLRELVRATCTAISMGDGINFISAKALSVLCAREYADAGLRASFMNHIVCYNRSARGKNIGKTFIVVKLHSGGVAPHDVVLSRSLHRFFSLHRCGLHTCILYIFSRGIDDVIIYATSLGR